MKSLTSILAITLFNLLPLTVLHAQGTTKSSERVPHLPAPANAPTFYHVHFTKAALGKAAQLGDWLKTPNPNEPMPNHFIVLRHQDGDAWDYAVITHLGPKATVEAAGTAVPPDKRDLSAWHNDTFVNGPSWEEFTKAMGIDGDSASRARARFILSLTIGLLPGIVSNWKKRSAKHPEQMTPVRATC